jgi:hypothetical protein
MTPANITPINQTYTAYMPEIQGVQDSATKAGFVYLIKLISGEYNGTYKIGYTERKNLKRRMSLLWDTDVVGDFHIEYLIETDAPYALEKVLHKTFEMKKSAYRREYYDLNADDIKQALNIALETDFNPFRVKCRKLLNRDPTSMEVYLYGKFGTDYHSIVEVAFTLASTRMYLNIETIRMFCPNDWSTSTIRNALHTLENLGYIMTNFTKKPREYMLNAHFWNEFRSRRDHDQLSALYRMDLITERTNKCRYNMSIGIKKENNIGYDMTTSLE